MSKAFTKEAEGGEVYDDLPDRPVSSHNLVTQKGLELIEAELARIHREQRRRRTPTTGRVLPRSTGTCAIGPRAGRPPR